MENIEHVEATCDACGQHLILYAHQDTEDWTGICFSCGGELFLLFDGNLVRNHAGVEASITTAILTGLLHWRGERDRLAAGLGIILPDPSTSFDFETLPPKLLMACCYVDAYAGLLLKVKDPLLLS